MDETLRLLLGPGLGEATGGGGAGGTPAGATGSGSSPGAAAGEPALDSTAGLSAEELAERPSFDDRGGAAAPGRGGGTGAAASPADPNIAAGLQGTAGAGQAALSQGHPAGAGGSRGVREAALDYGLDLSGFADDGAAWSYLMEAANRATEANYYADLGRRLAPQYDQIQQYLAQQQPRPAAAGQERRPWQHPEIDQRWLNFVERDPQTGTFRARPGANPQFADKVQAWDDSRSAWGNGLVDTPEQTLGPLIQQIVDQQIEERFGVQQRHQTAQSIMAAHEPWLYQRDGQGQIHYQADGQPILSAQGARYLGHLNELRSAGMSDPVQLDRWARRALANDEQLAAQQHAQLQQQQRGTAATAAATARPNVNSGQALEAHRRDLVPGAGTQPDYTGLSLSERLRRELDAAGVSDADFQTIA